MRLTRVDLRIVRLPLILPFETSSSVKDSIQHILVRVEDDHGGEGWGECASPADPYYCPETTGTCWHILRDFLVPSVLGKPWETIDDLVRHFGPIKGNGFARAGVEMACWDLLARSQDRSLATMLGGTRTEILSGVSLGIERDMGRLFDRIDQYVDEGYRRIKLKIKPGHDVDVVRQVRDRYPDLPLQVDANSAYTLAEIDHLKQLDDFGLLLIEQPLEHDDIIDHARLQAVMTTPICLDESIHSAADARKALDLGACRAINIKVSRVGGLLQAKKIHDLCHERGVPVWCGGMHEFGIGRAANVAIASLPGFTLPGDVSGSDKYYAADLVEPPVLAHGGAVAVPTGPGLGHSPNLEPIRKATIRMSSTHARGHAPNVTNPPAPEPDLSEIARTIQETAFGWFEKNRESALTLLADLIRHETPTRDKAACDLFAEWMVEIFGAPITSSCEIVPNALGGNHVRMQVAPAAREDHTDGPLRPGLILAHYDTVWPLKTIAARPFRIDGPIAHGPGLYDMKASLLILQMALVTLFHSAPPRRAINILITSDEETGSHTSRDLIEEMARGSEYVLVLEPPLANGALKTARKGVGDFLIEVTGKAAHAGVEPEKGANAIVELALQIAEIQSWNDPAKGTTLNVGTIHGGTTSNVVPEHASCHVDVRATTLDEAAAIASRISSLASKNPNTTLRVSGGFNRPPMERTPGVVSLFERTREVGRALGMDLTEGSTGGGSDGNFTAALGIPTLDGLGAQGGGAHAETEHIVLDSLAPKAALLAALLATL